MDFKTIKDTVENIKMPDGMPEEIIQNCEKCTGKNGFSKRTRNFVYRIVAAVLVVAIGTSAFFLWNPWEPNSVYGNDLMEGVIPNQVETKEPDEAWIQAVADFSVELFKNGQTTGENSLISPLSVYLTLAMTANGANGETLEEFEQVLGGGMPIEEMNVYAYSLLKRLLNENQETLSIKNSIWFDKKNSGKVYPEFLQSNADYYKSDAFQIDFLNEKDALEKVNNWVSQATDGEIKQMLNDIDPSTAFLLINTILFESKWKRTYEKPEYSAFQNATGEWVKVPKLEGIRKYIKNENAIGFINEYEDEQYSFVALLPKEGMSLEEYVNNLTGEELLNIINLETEETCLSYLPEFDYEYDMDLKNSLMDMGLNRAFGGTSDFSKMSEKGEMLYISKVDHKTFIRLNKEGTKAGAATVVQIPTRGSISYSGPNYVCLDRPFLYAIIDNTTKLPIFLGTVNQLEGENIDAPNYGTFLQEMVGVTYRVTKGSATYATITKIPEKRKKVALSFFMYNPDITSEFFYIFGVEAHACAGNKRIEEVAFSWDSTNKLIINEGAFANCPNLSKVIFDNFEGAISVNIADDAFAGSENVVFYIRESIYAKELQAYAQKHDIPVVLYDTAIRRIEMDRTVYWTSILDETEVSVEEIREEAERVFITNPEKTLRLTKISGYSCNYLENLEQVEFRLPNNPNFVIEEGAFEHNPNLKKIVFHNDDGLFATIEENAFYESPQVVFSLPEGAVDNPVYQYAVEHDIPVEFYDDSGEY